MLAVRVKAIFAGDFETVVVVENEDNTNHIHARLAAWLYKYGVDQMPTIKDLLENTEVYHTCGPVNAKIYKERHFEGEQFVDSKKIEYNADYYSCEYVRWLEEQLGIE